MPSLVEVITDPNRRRRVVDDGVEVIEAEVASKGGFTGMALKAAYATVKAVRPGFVGSALNHLLDDFAKTVDPIWTECQQGGGDPLPRFTGRAAAVADALLSITDKRARGASGPVRATYDRLRPEAKKHVEAAIPRVGGLLKRHAL